MDGMAAAIGATWCHYMCNAVAEQLVFCGDTKWLSFTRTFDIDYSVWIQERTAT